MKMANDDDRDDGGHGDLIVRMTNMTSIPVMVMMLIMEMMRIVI